MKRFWTKQSHAKKKSEREKKNDTDRFPPSSSSSRDVEFCGYTIPHPLVPKMNLRVQTTLIPATQALENGLNSMIQVTDCILDTFRKQVAEFKATGRNKMDIE